MRTLILAAVALSSAALAQTVVVKEGTGEVAVVNKDQNRAFEEAKTLAIRNAVEQAAGVRVESDTVVVNNQMVRDTIFARTDGYVKSYEVASKEVNDKLARVTVKASVLTESLEKDVQAARDLVKKMGRPSIVIAIQEQTVPLGDKVIMNSDVTATVLTEAFKADGWDIKDAQAMNKALKLDGAASLTGPAMKEIADLTKANYVLYGRTSLRHQAAEQMLQNSAAYLVSGEYDLVLAAIDSELQIAKVSGKLEWKTTKGIPVISYERTSFELIKERKSEIVDSVRKAVLEHFRNETMNGKRISVAVNGLENFSAAKDFKKALEAIKGIKDLTQDNFANGKATYRLVFAGTVDDLASEVETATFKKRKLNVVSATGSTIEISVAK